MALVDRQMHDFLQRAKPLLPKIRKDLNRLQGNYARQLEVIAHEVQEQMRLGKSEELSEIFTLIGNSYQPRGRDGEKMLSLIYHFFLIHLDFTAPETRSAWNALPQSLQTALENRWRFPSEQHWANRKSTNEEV